MTTPDPAAPAPRPVARLALEDGSIFRGEAFGATGRGIVSAAEVVFNTAMVGYQESLTDPSYAGQILVATFPLIGNYGVNDEDEESARVQVAGYVVRELARRPSNFRMTTDLSTYLARHGVLGLAGVDTRAVTRRLRTRGVMQGVLTDREDLADEQLVEMARRAPDMEGQNLVPLVGCSSKAAWTEALGEWGASGGSASGRSALRADSGRSTPEGEGERQSARRADLPVASPRRGDLPGASPRRGDLPGRFKVVALDCGAKRNILRNLTERGCDVTIVPHDISADELREMRRRGEADGIFVSNGPGDPAAVEATIRTLSAVIGPAAAEPIPTFGICLGHQLLSLALGAKTFKLKFGHRGLNQPVLNQLTGEVEITSQNHGFAVDPATLEAVGGEPTHLNLNDGTLAGFRMKDRPVFAVQHHPEASPGPHDAGYLFDAFVKMMEDGRAPSSETMRRTARGAAPADG